MDLAVPVQLRGAGPTDGCPHCAGLVVHGRGTLRDPIEGTRLRCLSCRWHRYMLPALPLGELIVAEPTPVARPSMEGVCAGCGTALPAYRGRGRRQRWCSKECGRRLLAA